MANWEPVGAGRPDQHTEHGIVVNGIRGELDGAARSNATGEVSDAVGEGCGLPHSSKMAHSSGSSRPCIDAQRPIFFRPRFLDSAVLRRRLAHAILVAQTFRL